MMSGIIPINIGQWIRRFKGKNRKARRSFENDILAHSQIKTISRHSESRRSQKQWKGIFCKSAQNDIICSLFTDERHSGCGCTVENKSDAQFLKSWQIHIHILPFSFRHFLRDCGVRKIDTNRGRKSLLNLQKCDNGFPSTLVAAIFFVDKGEE